MEPRRPFLLRAPDLCFSLGTAFLRLAVCTENLSSGVVLVKSAKDGVSFDASDSLNRTKNRRILVQGSMRSEVIITVGAELRCADTVNYIPHARSEKQPPSLAIESCAENQGTEAYSVVFQTGPVQLPRRRRTLKRDEHGARYFLRQKLRRMACVPTKNESRDIGSRTTFAKRYGRRSSGSAATPPD